MTLLLKQLFNFFKLLNSDTETKSLALGLSLGVVLGFAPILSLQGLLVILIIFFFRIQAGGAFLAAFFFKFVAWAFDPISDSLGRKILETESLRDLWVNLYNMPLMPLTRFNNSIVMGSGVVSLILLVPSYFLFKYLVATYRATILLSFRGTKVWKVFSATSFYKWYAKYNELYG